MIKVILFLLSLSGSLSAKESFNYFAVESSFSVGTAFAVKVNNKAYIITAGHLCDKPGLKFLYAGESKLLIKKINIENDLCLLSPDTALKFNITPLLLNLKYKDEFGMAIGFSSETPNNFKYIPLFINKNPLRVSIDKKVNGTFRKCIGVIYRGMSGGPILNQRNEVIGTITATDTIQFSYIVPAIEIRNFLNGVK